MAKGGTMKLKMKKFWINTVGQDLVEYALAGGLIALVAVTSFSAISTKITSVFAAVAAVFG
jgi:Flp pilus assembly pilin Flp